MKRLLINMVILSLLVETFSSCKKTLDSEFNNPDLPTTASIGSLFTGMELNNRIHESYWDYYTFIMSITAPFSQMVAIAPSNGMYTPSDNYMASRWEDYYDGSIPSGTTTTPDYRYDGPGIMSNYRSMQTAYAALDPADQANQYVFLQVANVIVCDQTAQMIDLWGDIPFSQANSLNITGSAVNAPFDDAATLYDTLISTLDELNTYFDTVSSSSTTGLSSQDMIYQGNIANWRRYANSLRLRLLMRISNVNPTEAQTKVTAMLDNPDQYPLITDNSQNALMNQSPMVLYSDLAGATTGQGPNSMAPSYLLDSVMVANNDPRVQVLWDTVAAGTANKDTIIAGTDTIIGAYIGISPNATSAQYSAAFGNHSVSPYDSATISYNYNVPGVLFTAAETEFLIAEADVRWTLGDEGMNEYYNGIQQSIDFWYGINQSRIAATGSNNNWITPTTPSAADISAFEAQPNIAFASSTQQQLAQIYTQKWLSFFIVQAQQAWAEYRRTGYPQLNFYANTSSGENQTPPTRLKYPQAETLYNTYYSTVKAQDTWTNKIFWDVN